LLKAKKKKGLAKKVQPNKWNKVELETKAVVYLITNPRKSINDFCLNENISYQYFIKKCDLHDIYKKVDETLSKKQQERLNSVEKNLKAQAKEEAFDITKLFDISVTAITRGLSYLNNNTVNFRSDGDALRTVKDFASLILDLRDKGLIPNFIAENPYKDVIDSVNRFAESSKNIIDDKNNNNDVVNDNNRATTTI
jgi:hypothetical protein